MGEYVAADLLLSLDPGTLAVPGSSRFGYYTDRDRTAHPRHLRYQHGSRSPGIGRTHHRGGVATGSPLVTD